jgi:hypothetical protein
LPKELLLHCFAPYLPYGNPKIYLWAAYVGYPIICEGKFGMLTFVHPDCPEDIRVKYDDGTTNSVNTHCDCLATDGYGEPSVERGSVRLLRWDEEGLAEMTPAHDLIVSNSEANSVGTWTVHRDIFMGIGQGDISIVPDWKSKMTIDDLKRIVEKCNYSGFIVSDGHPSFGDAKIKNFDFQITPKHCKPNSTGHPIAFYIYQRPVGGKILANPNVTEASRAEDSSAEEGSWSVHENIDMCNQGDTHIIPDWKSKVSIDDLKNIVERFNYSCITVSSGKPSFGHAAIKNFDFQLTPAHCKPISTCCSHPCTIYIYKRPSSVQPQGLSLPSFRLRPKSDPKSAITATGHYRGACVLSKPDDTDGSIWSAIDHKSGLFRIALHRDSKWSINHGLMTLKPGDCNDDTLHQAKIQMYDDKWINSHFRIKEWEGEYCRLEPNHAPGWHLAVEDGKIWLRNDHNSNSLWAFEEAISNASTTEVAQVQQAPQASLWDSFLGWVGLSNGFGTFASLESKMKNCDLEAMKEIVVRSLNGRHTGWVNIEASAVELQDISGKGGNRTYKVSVGRQDLSGTCEMLANSNAAPAVMKLYTKSGCEQTVLRVKAAHAAMAEKGCTAQSLASGSFWLLHAWAGSSPHRDNLSGKCGRLLARAHSADASWYDPIRASFCGKCPALSEAPHGSHIWYFTTLFESGMMDHLTWMLSQNLHEPSSEIARAFVFAGPTPASEAGSRVVTSHGDFHGANIVEDEDGNLRFIDFDMSCVQFAVFDIAYNFKLHCRDNVSRHEFLQAYLEESGLPSRNEDINTLWLDVERCRMNVGFFSHSLSIFSKRMHSGDNLLLVSGLGAELDMLVAVADKALEDAELAEEMRTKGFFECGAVKTILSINGDPCAGSPVSVRKEDKNTAGLINFDGTVQFKHIPGLVLGTTGDGGVILTHPGDKRQLQLSLDGLEVTGISKPSSKPVPLLLSGSNSSERGCGIQKLSVKGPANTGLSWAEAARQAAEAGGRLPTVREVISARLMIGISDQWQPVGDKGSDFWIQVGQKRTYITEVPSEAWRLPPDQGWGNDSRAHPWRPTSIGSTEGSPVHYFYAWMQQPVNQALVLSPHVSTFADSRRESVPVQLLAFGAREDALMVHFCDDETIRLAENPLRALTCVNWSDVVISPASGHECQKFVRSADHTISPATMPEMVLGIRGDSLVLLPKQKQGKQDSVTLESGQVPYNRLSVSASRELGGQVAFWLLDSGKDTHVPPYFTSKWNAHTRGPLQIDITVDGGSICLSRYALRSADDCPGCDPLAWNMSGVDEAGAEHVLHTEENGIWEKRWQWKTFPVECSTRFHKFRINIMQNHGDECTQLGQLQLFADQLDTKEHAGEIQYEAEEPRALVFDIPEDVVAKPCGVNGSSVVFAPGAPLELSFCTRGKYDYTDAFVGDVSSLQEINFSVRAGHNARIALGESMEHDGKHWEIALGENYNTVSAIRSRISGSEVAVYDGTVLQAEKFCNFWISWKSGFLRVGQGETIGKNEFMAYSIERHGIQIQKMHVATDLGERGSWRIRCVAEAGDLVAGSIGEPAVDNVYSVDVDETVGMVVELAGRDGEGFCLKKLGVLPEDQVQELAVGPAHSALPLLLKNNRLCIGSGNVTLGIPKNA